MMMMMVTETESNGQKPVLHDHHHHQGSDEKGRRHPRWTREETLCLIQAKEITENTPHKGRKMTSASAGAGSENTEPKWVMISAQCKQQGVNRGPAQCRKRWSNLIGDYKKVKAWEDKLTDKSESFWVMRNDMRKERRLPVSFDREVFRVLEGRENGPPGLAVFPLPLQAVAAALVSDDGDDGEEEEEAEEESEPESGPEPEPECEPKEMVNDGHGVEIEDLLVSEFRGEELGEEATVLGWKSEEKQTATNNATNNVTDIPVKEFCRPEPISEQHHQAFQNQKTQPSQATGAFRESWPGISYWNSQERGKRRRLSADGNQANDKEDKIIRALKTNNKMLHDQLDVHNKNCQLDREQRKESNDALLAALGKLTDAIVKIAERL